MATVFVTAQGRGGGGGRKVALLQLWFPLTGSYVSKAEPSGACRMLQFRPHLQSIIFYLTSKNFQITYSISVLSILISFPPLPPTPKETHQSAENGDRLLNWQFQQRHQGLEKCHPPK